MNILSRKFKMRVPGTQHREYVSPTAWTCLPTEGVVARKRMQVNPYAGTYIKASAMTLCGQDLTEIGDCFINICHTREGETERCMT